MVNLINTGAGTDSSTLFVADNQLEVAAVYHSPSSIGFGLGYKIGKHRIHLSAEWFDAVLKYNVLETKNFVGQSDGKTYENRVNTEAKSVLNYGIGGEFYLKEKLWLYVSFVTDYTANIPDTKTNLGISTWDIFHLSGGVLFSIGRSEITVGTSYAYGNEKLRGQINLPEGEIVNDLNDLLKKSDLKYMRIKFLLGFSFELK